MGKDSAVRLVRPISSVVDEPLLLVLRDGVRRMLEQMIASEVEAFPAAQSRGPRPARSGGTRSWRLAALPR